MQTDFLQYIFQAINNLLTQNLGFFDTMGQNLFRSFATILVAWFGIKSALASASGRPSFQFDHFASLLLTISFGFAMVTYYSTPIPGVGVSFHNLVTNEAQFLSTQIDQAQLQTVVTQVANFEARMDSPGWGDLFGTAIYIIVTILLAAAQAIAIVVIAYGFIATAVCVLVGPVFVPFFIVPKMEWLFWGWFRCFIQPSTKSSRRQLYTSSETSCWALCSSRPRARFPQSNSLPGFPSSLLRFSPRFTCS
jgi:hypothetical protein